MAICVVLEYVLKHHHLQGRVEERRGDNKGAVLREVRR